MFIILLPRLFYIFVAYVEEISNIKFDTLTFLPSLIFTKRKQIVNKVFPINVKRLLKS